jgi:acyl-CoA synthetase (AMP-forming)/AMP-acid ligase II
MMQGYHNAPALTAQVLDAEGWFYTGDIGVLGEDGYLRLVDRAKDMIVRGGEKIYPAEVETHLERHPLIRRAAVIGVPSGLAGEEVWAYVEPQPGARLNAADVLDFCRGQIAACKLPDEVRFTDRLPLTAAGKVQKFRLRELAGQEASPHVPT